MTLKPLNRRRWYVLMNSLVAFWLVAASVIVVAHRFVPAGGWLMVHLLLLGALSTAILIWSQHFADTLLRRTAPGGRVFHAARLLAHTVGAALVVAGVLTSSWPLVLSGGATVAAAVIAHVVSLAVQSHGALPARFAPLVRYYIAAGLSLVVGVAIGVVMSRAQLDPGIGDRLYPAHIGFNLLGWVGFTVVGTVILLWPTVLRTRVSDRADATARAALVLLVCGLLVYGAACLLGWRDLVLLGIVLYLAGLGLVIADGVVQARRSPPTTFAGYSIAAAVGWFAVCTAALGVIVGFAPEWADARPGLGWLVGPFAVGFAAQILLGALSYLLPVVLGGGPLAARRSAAELERGSLFRVLVTNAGILIYILPAPSFVKVVVSFVVFLVLASFLVFAVRAVLAVRSGRTGVDDEQAKAQVQAQTTNRSTGGSFAVAAGTLILAVTVGVALDPVAAGVSTAKPVSAIAATGNTTIVQVSMADMRFTPDTVVVPVGDELVIELTNDDDQVHDLVLANGVSSGRLAAGETATVEVGVVAADIDGWCSIAGHRAMGMVMTVIAEGAIAQEGDHGPEPGSGPSAAADIDLMSEPGPGFEAWDAALPPTASATVHELTLTVREEVREVAPGVTQTLWTYNGMTPGPTLRGKVGDVFDITLVNDGSIGHSVDFHAGALAPDRPMRTIGPGESLNYRFTATRSGIWLYHCSTMPMSVHIANGMFGAVIIDPAGLGAVDREYLMVQSEYYLGQQEGEVDAERVSLKSPDLVVFNGYANQYRHAPLTAKVGEKVRIWVLDAGPNLATSFHIVGGQFDTVFAEGEYLLHDGGSTGTGGAQSLGLQPAQGGFVELTFTEAGNYSLVSHIMSDAERGAAGTITVTAN